MNAEEVEKPEGQEQGITPEVQLAKDLKDAGFGGEETPPVTDEPNSGEPSPAAPSDDKDKQEKPDDSPAVPDNGTGAEVKPEEKPPVPETPPEAEPPQTPAQQGQQTRMEQAATAFAGLVRIVNGNAAEGVTMTAEQGKRFVEENFTPLEVSVVRRAAQEGRFGEESADVLALVEEVFPNVMANAPLIEQRRQMEAQAERVYREGEAALAKEYPDWNKKGSDTQKMLYGFHEELSRLVPNFNVLPTAPVLLREYAGLKKQAGRVAELEAQLKAEKERAAALEKRFGGGLPNRGTSHAPGGRGDRAFEQLEADLKAAGFEQ